MEIDHLDEPYTMVQLNWSIEDFSQFGPVRPVVGADLTGCGQLLVLTIFVVNICPPVI
jgi:hypothetical protein